MSHRSRRSSHARGAGSAVVATVVVLGAVGLLVLVVALPWVMGEKPATAVAAPGGDSADLAHGRELFLNNCASCHGAKGQGMPRRGNPLQGSDFVARSSDRQLLEMIKTGRDANHPANRSRLPMPPRGGNPALTDEDLQDVVALLRVL